MSEKIWMCKIGGIVGDLIPGADLPMRLAIQEAFERLTGCSAEFCFSGWSAQLDVGERGIIEEERSKKGVAQ